MSKDPAFLFYDGDAARDVSHMNRLERGCYFDLIQAQRKFGGYSVEQARKILGKDFDECWPSLELILKCENGKYFIEWVSESINKRAENAEIQRKRIQDYWDRKKNEGNTNVIPRNNHGNTLENENEIENEIEDIIDPSLVKKVKKPKVEKIKVAEFVSLTPLEHGTLIQDYGEEIAQLIIEKLDNYKGSTGKKYLSDYRAMKSWVINQVIVDSQQRSNGQQSRGKQPATSTEDIRAIVDHVFGDQPIY